MIKNAKAAAGRKNLKKTPIRKKAGSAGIDNELGQSKAAIANKLLVAAPNYRSLVPGGFFSSDPYDHSVPTAIRTNNPGAINASHSWVLQFAGYVGKDETTPGNLTAIFEAPEFGVALWWTLFKRYKASLDPTFTLHTIIYKYCGAGREREARDYLAFVCRRTGLPEDYAVDLMGDQDLQKIARAFYRYEAGKESPLLDKQILYGFNYARNMRS
jgi:hypothetical protein